MIQTPSRATEVRTMNKAAQSHLFGEVSDDAAAVKSDGRTMRPAMELLTALVDETRLHFDEDGIRATHVDPANVGAGDFHIHREAFDIYDLDAEFTTALNVAKFADTVQNARMSTRTNDVVEFDVDRTRTLTTVHRDYDQTTVQLTNEILNIDPESVREEPNVSTVDQGVQWKADIDIDALHDVVTHVSEDVVDVREREGHLIVGADDGLDDREGDYSVAADFGEIAEPLVDNAATGALSKFSMDYLDDMVGALKKAKVTDVSLRWGHEFPAALDFERVEDETTLYEGRFMLAPRIGGE